MSNLSTNEALNQILGNAGYDSNTALNLIAGAVQELSGTGITTDADKVTYDNTTSGLAATDMQAATDELNDKTGIQYQSGIYTTFNQGFANGATRSKALNVIHGVLIFCENDCQLSEVIVSIAAGAVGNGIVIIYEMTGGYGLTQDFNFVAQTLEFNTNITGNQYLSISANLKKGGIYALCVHANATITYNCTGFATYKNIIGHGFSAGETTSTSSSRSCIGYSSLYSVTAPLNFSTSVGYMDLHPFLRFKIE